MFCHFVIKIILKLSFTFDSKWSPVVWRISTARKIKNNNYFYIKIKCSNSMVGVGFFLHHFGRNYKQLLITKHNRNASNAFVSGEKFLMFYNPFFFGCVLNANFDVATVEMQNCMPIRQNWICCNECSKWKKNIGSIRTQSIHYHLNVIIYYHSMNQMKPNHKSLHQITA